MDRRRFLAASAGGTGLLAGCAGLLPSGATPDSEGSTVPSDATVTDWPMRGRTPTHRAVAGEPPSLDGRRQWEVSLPAQSATAPVVAGDILTIGVGNTVLAVAPTDGSRYWRAELDAAITGQPVVHEGRVFVGTRRPGFAALDVRTGERLWTYEYRGNTRGTPVRTPAVADNTAVATLDRQADLPTVLAVDADTGERQWMASPLEDPAAPVPVDGEVYTAGVAQSLADGQVSQEWSKAPDVGVSPAVTDHGVFILEYTGEKPTQVYSLPEFGAEPAWTVEIPRPLGAMPVVTERFVFVSGHAIAIDSGRVEYTLDTEIRSPPAVADGVGLLSRRRSVVAFAPATGAIRWTDEIPQVTRPTQPALTADGAYVAAGDRLIAYQ